MKCFDFFNYEVCTKCIYLANLSFDELAEKCRACKYNSGCMDCDLGRGAGCGVIWDED